jgi:hypothetical protein
MKNNSVVRMGKRKLVERKMIERKLAADNWAIRKIVAMKISRYENWTLRKLIAMKY